MARRNPTVALSRCLAGDRLVACRRCEHGLDSVSRIRAHSIGILGQEPPSEVVIPCLQLSVCWYPALLNCPYVAAVKKCKSQASTHFQTEAMPISAFINAPHVTTKCGLPSGLLTQQPKGPPLVADLGRRARVCLGSWNPATQAFNPSHPITTATNVATLAPSIYRPLSIGIYRLGRPPK